MELLYIVMLSQITSRTEKLNIRCRGRRSALGKRDDMVIVQVFIGATIYTTAFVPLPYFNLDAGRYKAIMLKL